MKNLFLLLAAALTLSCCNKDDDNKATNPVDQLPPATQTGANTAGCLVNGQVFLPKGYFSAGTLNCNYTDGLNFDIRISEKINDNIRSLYVFNYNQQLIEGQVYILKEDSSTTGFGIYVLNSVASPNPNYYSTTSTITGELKITNHDFDNAILSGTFWFDAINSEGVKVQVREGRFDMHY